MSTMEIQSLNRDITNERISKPYPHVLVLDPSDAIALILPELPEGDLAVLCNFNGTCRQIGSIRKSPLVLNTLRRITGIDYVVSENCKKSIRTALDALEVFS